MRFNYLCSLLTSVLVALSIFYSPLTFAQSYPEKSNISAAPSDPYQRYLRMKNPELLKKGWHFLYSTEHPDSAMFCFTIVAEREKPNLSEKERKEVFEGWCGRWEANFWAYYNYEASLQDYQKLLSLQEKWGIKSARPEYYLAMHKVSDFNLDPEKSNIKIPHDYMKKAFNTAVDEEDTETALRIFGNLVRTTFINSNDDLEAEWKRLSSMGSLTPQQLDLYGEMLSALHLLQKGEKLKAVGKIDQILAKYTEAKLGPKERLDIATLIYLKAAIYREANLYKEAEKAWLQTIDYTYRYNQRELRQISLEELAVLYKQTGQKKKLEEISHHCVLLKDSLWNSRITKGLEQIKFDETHREMVRKMVTMEYQQKVLRWAIFAAVIVILCFLMFIWSLRRANNKLRARNNMLYDNVRRDALDTSRDLSADMTKEETLNPEPEENEENLEETPEQREDAQIETPENGENNSAEAAKQTEKTASRPNQVMTVEARNKLAKEIDKIMRGEAPFSGEFSMAKLAQLCATNTRYVSYAINEVFGCNFQTLVNRIRIREACRRIDNQRKYGHYSNEGIAESVGFNSRSAFNAAFKKYTGLSAGEYRKIAKERHKRQTRE